MARKLLSDRLLALLTAELARLEALKAETGPRPSRPSAAAVKKDGAGSGEAGSAKIGPDDGRGGATKARSTSTPAVPQPAISPKERIDALVQLTRMMEKLLDLRRLEALTRGGGDEDAAETARLREEFLARLRAVDALRTDGGEKHRDGTAAASGERS